MPDSSRRVVFSSEAGVTFFDFGFKDGEQFHVNSILKKMDRKAVVSTLRKDFSLLLGEPFRNRPIESWSGGSENYFGITGNKETSYFVINTNCSNLQRLELGSRKKRKVTIEFKGADTVNIDHHTFPMQIQLLRFRKE